MIYHQNKILSLIIIGLILLSVSSSMADNTKSGVVYDIQCGCFSDPLNAARFAHHLQELGLSWYNIPSGPCTRFIVDVNVDWLGISYFINEHVEFMDAFLVRNYWDLPSLNQKNSPSHLSKKNYIRIMAPYMQQQYIKSYYNPEKLALDDKLARIYTATIYEASDYYELDPFLLFALGNFESYFSNVLGDLNRLKRKVPDPAQGMFQILRSTARMIYDDMKSQNLPHTPEKFPTDLRKYPKDQIYFAAHYLHNLHKDYHGNRYMALLFYNARSKPNYDYPRKVMSFYQHALTHYRESLEQIQKTETLVIEAHHYPRETDQQDKILSQ